MTKSQRIQVYILVITAAAILYVYGDAITGKPVLVQLFSILTMIAAAIPLHQHLTTAPAPTKPQIQLRELDPHSRGFFVEHAQAPNQCLYRICFRAGVPERFGAWLRYQDQVKSVSDSFGKYEVLVDVSGYCHASGNAVETITNYVQTFFKIPMPV